MNRQDGGMPSSDSPRHEAPTPDALTPDAWLLTVTERENPASVLSAGGAERGWSAGNTGRAIIHGRAYFAELHERIAAMGPGDRLYFTDWRGDPDEQLTDDPSSTLTATLTAAARRGVDVRGLLWRSHWRHFGYQSDTALFLGEEIGQAGGECLRDMRVRTGGAHHQKFVVVRHAGDPSRDIAYVGGIDLCHSRRDDREHGGDVQALPMAAAYGPTPAWHDVQVAITGPAVHDVETTFRERWEDSTPLTLNPGRRLTSFLRREDQTPDPLGEQWPPPPPTGSEAVQIVRTYPVIRPVTYDFAPEGERSIVLANTKAMSRARRLIYVEDQYFWGEQVGEHFATRLREEPGLHLAVVLPMTPDVDSVVGHTTMLYARWLAMSRVLEAGGDRVAFFGLTNRAGLPIYVHSKVCVIDGVWASVGSDNLNRRSWSSDTEIAALVVPDGSDSGATIFASRLQRELVAEHLGCAQEDVPDDPVVLFETMVASAAALDQWYAAASPPGASGVRSLPGRAAARVRRADGRRMAKARTRSAGAAAGWVDRAVAAGDRPPGQLRRLWPPELTRAHRAIGRAAYGVFDPDGTVGRDEDLEELATGE